MSKTIFTVFVLIFAININVAQSNHRIGITAGPNLYSFRGSDLTKETESGIGYFAGATFEYYFNKHWSVKTGLNFERKVINYDYEFNLIYYDSQTDSYYRDHLYAEVANNYNYLTVPLLLKYNFGKNESFFVNGGFFISYMFSYNEKAKIVSEFGYPTSLLEHDNFPLSDYLKNKNYGFSFGIGKSFRLNKKNSLNVEIREDIGMNNLVEGINMGGVNGTIKTNTLSLIAGWSFDI